MTSKNSFIKLLALCIKGRVWGVAIACLGLFFSLPITAAVEIANIKEQIKYEVYQADVLENMFRRDVMGNGNGFLVFLIVVLAVFIAINGFSYLFSKQKVDLYHSMPIKRGALFVANYIAGIISFVVPYIVFILLAYIVGMANGVVGYRTLQITFATFLINILGYLFIYSVAVLAVIMTGNLAVSVMGIGVFFFYIPLFLALVEGYQGTFFDTFAAQYTNKPYEFSSPVFTYLAVLDGINGYGDNFTFEVKSLVFLIFCGIILSVVDYILFGKRASEMSAKAMAFKKSMPVIAIALLVPVSLCGGLGFMSLISVRDNSYGWMIFGMIASLLLGHFVIQTIYYLDFKSLLKNLINPLIAGVITSLIAIIFVFDLTGYDKYIPDKDDVVSAAYSSYSLQGNQEYYNFDSTVNEYGYKDVWMDLEKYRLDNMTVIDKDVINDFAEKAVSDSNIYKVDENTEGKILVNILTKYTFKNGKTKYRNYTLNLTDHFDTYSMLYKQKEYKEGVYTILTARDDELNNLSFDTPIGTTSLENLSEDEAINLVNTLRDEMYGQDALETKESMPIGFLYKNYEVDENGGTSTYVLDKAYVYPSFTKTIELLKEYGVDFDEIYNIDKIQEIKVSYYGNNSDMCVESEEKVFSNKNEIEEIMKDAVPYDMVCVDGLFHETEAMDVIVYYSPSDDTNIKTVSMSYEKGKIPEVIKKAVNY